MVEERWGDKYKQIHFCIFIFITNEYIFTVKHVFKNIYVSHTSTYIQNANYK